MSIVAIAGQPYRLRIELESQAAPGTFVSWPTVAAGDVKILSLPASPVGDEVYDNSDNDPTVVNGPTAEVIISEAETATAGHGGELVVIWADALGDEWYSLSVHIQVKASDLALQGAAGDTLETLSDQIDAIAACGAGSGAVSYPITVNNESSNPIDGVEVWITTDSAGTNVVAGTLSTDASGIVTFMLDAGSYYVWRQKSGYNFANPVAITVT